MTKYTLKDYLDLMNNYNLVVDFDLKDKENLIIDYLTYNSKKVTDNTFFICKGAAFKAKYLTEAIEQGACCYISQEKYPVDEKIPYIIVNDIRKAMPPLADKFNNSPWKKLKLTGFGGTKGKSTSAYYMKSVVDEYMAKTGGKESGIISSINTYDGVINIESHITTPEAVELQEHFQNAITSDITFLEMEVSSQALKYNRIDNITLDVGVFLNISEDHISPIEHPDFDDYFNAKLKIFDNSKYAVVNLDADFSDKILQASKVCEKTYTISTKDPSADIYGYDIHKEGHETIFTVCGPGFTERFALTMPGLFNVENALAVIAASLLLEIPLEFIKSGLYKARTSGRMELYTSQDKEKIAVVDYAHNKLSFEKLFESVSKEYPDYNVVAIFGCPGGKAINRREDLGTIAGKCASMVYITAEDPASESFMDISNEIAKFVEDQNCPYKIIEDRGEAIKYALDHSEGKTIFLITGKGNETRQKYGTKYIDCKSDVEYVKEFFDIK